MIIIIITIIIIIRDTVIFANLQFGIKHLSNDNNECYSQETSS